MVVDSCFNIQTTTVDLPHDVIQTRRIASDVNGRRESVRISYLELADSHAPAVVQVVEVRRCRNVFPLNVEATDRIRSGVRRDPQRFGRRPRNHEVSGAVTEILQRQAVAFRVEPNGDLDPRQLKLTFDARDELLDRVKLIKAGDGQRVTFSIGEGHLGSTLKTRSSIDACHQTGTDTTKNSFSFQTDCFGVQFKAEVDQTLRTVVTTHAIVENLDKFPACIEGESFPVGVDTCRDRTFGLIIDSIDDFLDRGRPSDLNGIRYPLADDRVTRPTSSAGEYPEVLRGLVIERPRTDHLKRATAAHRVDQFKPLPVITNAHDDLAGAEVGLECFIDASKHLLNSGHRLADDLAIVIANLSK